MRRSRRRKRAEEIQAELEYHIERRARMLMRSGLSPDAARAEARRRLGDPQRIEEDCMRTWERHWWRKAVLHWLDDAVRDVALAFRGFRRRPALATGVVLTLALAIGAATSVFSVVNGVLVRPLPYPDDDGLYSVWTRYLPATGLEQQFFTVSGPELVDYGNMTRAMSGVAGYRSSTVNLAPDDGPPERLTAVEATANLFDVLEVQPAFGRGFAADDGLPDAECVTVMAHGLWRDRFGRDASVVGRDVHLNGRPCRVIGVMPAGFTFPDEVTRLWTAMYVDPTSGRGNHPYQGIARLAPDATLATAEAELDALRATWTAEYPEDAYALGHFIVLRSLREEMVGDTRPALLLLLGAVGTVLLIVCVNVAGLLLAGGESRRKEFAVRAALGVGRGRLVRQLLTESVMLSAIGGVLGFLAAGLILRGMLALYPGGVPRASEVATDGAALLFTATIAISAGVLFGIIPALQTSAVRSADVLRATGRGTTTVRARRAFVVIQFALALVLALGSAVLARSYAELRQVDLGFEPDNVLTFSVAVPPGSYPDDAEARQYFANLEERLAAIPGAVAAGVVTDLPLVTSGSADYFIIEGRPEPAPGQPTWNAHYQMATPGAQSALGLRVVRGRWFEAQDRSDAPHVAVINEATVRAFFQGEDVIGRRIRYNDSDGWITIIGVVEDVRSLAVEEDAPPAIYTAFGQAPRSPGSSQMQMLWSYWGRFANLVVRFDRSTAAGASTVRAAALEVDPTLPPSDIRTLEGIVTETVGRPRFTTTIMSAFAGLALLLGALGIYGVLAHSVQLRTREIGIRLALGAAREKVLWAVVRQGIGLALAGIMLGLAAALALRGVVEGLLFGVGPLDLPSLALTCATLLTVSVAASTIPALRAIHVDPSAALRAE